jgi:hypothetical protein
MRNAGCQLLLIMLKIKIFAEHLQLDLILVIHLVEV